MVKSRLIEAQFPVGSTEAPSAERLMTTLLLQSNFEGVATPILLGNMHLRGQDRGHIRLRTERTGHLNHANTYRMSEAWDRLRGASPMATEFP
jgi:hypothetical protein